MIEKKVHEKIDLLGKYKLLVEQVDPMLPSGNVYRIAGQAILSDGPRVHMGEICRVEVSRPTRREAPYLFCEVIGFDEGKVVLMPMGSLQGISQGDRVFATGHPLKAPVSEELLGRVLDGGGSTLDEKGKIVVRDYLPLDRDPPNPSRRPLIRQALRTGVRSIDGFLSIGRGQRIGIFAGSGVGKSSLLGMIARYTDADISVIALVGERSRELNEFIQNDLGAEGLKKSVVLTATSDRSPIQKINCALMATTIAEYFRDQGKDVNLMMDSLTRFAHAKREIGTWTREPSITQGYPPSVFAGLSRLVERAGTTEKGSITGFYNVLVDADDLNDPIADAVRGYLDGHIVLSRELASANHYPAVDVLDSVSRVMPNIASREHQHIAGELRKYMAIYRDNEELIHFGGYSRGSNPETDAAIDLHGRLRPFLVQAIREKAEFPETLEQMKNLYENLGVPG